MSSYFSSLLILNCLYCCIYSISCLTSLIACFGYGLGPSDDAHDLRIDEWDEAKRDKYSIHEVYSFLVCFCIQISTSKLMMSFVSLLQRNHHACHLSIPDLGTSLDIASVWSLSMLRLLHPSDTLPYFALPLQSNAAS